MVVALVIELTMSVARPENPADSSVDRSEISQGAHPWARGRSAPQCGLFSRS